MEQAFPATDNTWQAAMWRRFRRGEVATLQRKTDFTKVPYTTINCAKTKCAACGIPPDREHKSFCRGGCHAISIPVPKTWAEKVNKPVAVPVFDAKFAGCDVTHWRVPFGWIPAQNGDEANFRD